MNKKGMTLMELVVSIALLSVALVYVYGLMTELQRKKNKTDDYNDNLIKIAEIEVDVQQHLLDFISMGRTKADEITIDATSSMLSLNITRTSAGITSNKERRVTFLADEVVAEELSGGSWTTLKRWSLSSRANSVDIKTKNHQESGYIIYDYKVYFLDDTDKVIDMINIPFYLKGDNIYLNEEAEIVS